MMKDDVLSVLAAVKAQWDQETEALIDLVTTNVLAKLGHTARVELDTQEMVTISEMWKLDRRLVVHPYGTIYQMQIVPRIPLDQIDLDL